MKKINYSEIMNKIKKVIASDNKVIIYQLINGDIVKIFNPVYLDICKKHGSNIENKVMLSDEIKLTKEIVSPKTAIYNINNLFIGYVMDKVKGINYNDYLDSFNSKEICDLKLYSKVHNEFETILVKNKQIVFPDICSLDNVYYSKNEGFNFIDYDDFQICKEKSVVYSTSLGETKLSKYHDLNDSDLLTKQVDIKSSIILYFLITYNLDLNKVGEVNPYTKKRITLQDVFEIVNLDDSRMYDIVQKIYNKDVLNEFLGDSIMKLSEKYRIEVLGKYPNTTSYIKVLKKTNDIKYNI